MSAENGPKHLLGSIRMPLRDREPPLFHWVLDCIMDKDRTRNRTLR